jgi:hypothetical protein
MEEVDDNTCPDGLAYYTSLALASFAERKQAPEINGNGHVIPKTSWAIAQLNSPQ